MATPLRQTLVCPIMVGRSAHLDAIHTALERVSAGSGQTALMAGEAGIGKTRMVTETRLRAARSGFALLQGNCFEPDRSLAYGPLLDLLRAYAAGTDSAELLATLDSSAPEVLKLLPELASRLPGVAPTAPLEPEQEKRRLFEALVQIFARLTAQRPLLVVVEDVHWADDTSLEFLLLLARRVPSRPILLLLTYRSDEVHPGLRRFLAGLDRARLAEEWPLEPLDAAGVDAMLRAIFDLDRPARSDFLDALYELTEGNPFFVEESLKSLVVAGDIFYSGGRWDRKATSELNIPRSVQDAVERRTAQLSAEAREVLILAAVTGQRFDFALLQLLTGREEDELLRVIKELIAAQLVVEVSEEAFLFRHALTRQAVSSQLLARERKARHRAILEAQERLYADQLDAHLAELAYHAYEAGMWQQAHTYSWQVAEHALAVYAPAAAIEHFTRALKAAQHLSLAANPQLFRGRGQAYETLGDFEHAERDYQEALAAARAAGGGRAEWQALIDLGFLWSARDYARMGDFLRSALERAEALDDDALRAHTLNRLGNWLVNTGDPAEGLQMHQQALAIFEARSDRLGTAQTYDLLGMASGMYGDAVASVAACGRAVEELRALGDIPILTSSLTTRPAFGTPQLLQTTYSALPSPDACERDLAEALRLARQMGSLVAQAYTAFVACAAALSFGRFGEGVTRGREALRLAEEAEHQQWMAATHSTLANGYVLMLAPRRAIEEAELALQLAHAVGSAFWAGNSTSALAQGYLLAGHPEKATRVLNATLPPEHEPRNLTERSIRWVQGLVALAQGDPEGALRIAGELLATAPGSAPDQAIPWLLKLKGDACVALDRAQEAIAAYEAADRGAVQRYELPARWQIQAALGHAYARVGRHLEAEGAFQSAQEQIAALAATLDDEALREEFQRAALARLPQDKAPAPRREDRTAYGRLTGREREVVALVARGLSNRAIAKALVLSERTVESHVTNILGKLGFTSRAQIAAWAAEGVLLPAARDP